MLEPQFFLRNDYKLLVPMHSWVPFGGRLTPQSHMSIWFQPQHWILTLYKNVLTRPGPLCEHHDEAAGEDEQDSPHKKERLVHQGEDEVKVGMVQVIRLQMWPHKN